MTLQGAEEGSHPPAAAAAAVDPDHLLLPAQWERGGQHCGPSAVSGIGLPDDPLLEILARLPFKSLFRFKCVSKAWFGLIADYLRKISPTLPGFFYGSDNYFFSLLGKSAPPVDPSFSFLTKLPEVQQIILLDSCNGLVLFLHRQCSHDTQKLGYIVCNPATEEWVAVPSLGCTLDESEEDYGLNEECSPTYLIFGPSVSSQFKLVQFCWDSGLNIVHVHIYLSESGVWSSRAIGCWSHDFILPSVGSVFVNGILHLVIYRFFDKQDVIVAVDEEGEKSRIIRWPGKENGELIFLGQSQGSLHCMSENGDQTVLSIWVLEDYSTDQWTLKDSVSSLQLLGEESFCNSDPLTHITIHPSQNLVFFVDLDGKLMSYDMDSKEVSALCTLEHFSDSIIPYFPNFVDSLALAKKH